MIPAQTVPVEIDPFGANVVVSDQASPNPAAPPSSVHGVRLQPGARGECGDVFATGKVQRRLSAPSSHAEHACGRGDDESDAHAEIGEERHRRRDGARVLVRENHRRRK